MTDRAATRVSPRVLDITEKRGTFGVFTCRLSEGGAQSVLYSGPGSAQDLKRHLQVPADPDLVVVSLTQGVGLDLIAPACEVAAAPRVLLATDWAAFADSLGGGWVLDASRPGAPPSHCAGVFGGRCPDPSRTASEYRW